MKIRACAAWVVLLSSSGCGDIGAELGVEEDDAADETVSQPLATNPVDFTSFRPGYVPLPTTQNPNPSPMTLPSPFMVTDIAANGNLLAIETSGAATSLPTGYPKPFIADKVAGSVLRLVRGDGTIPPFGDSATRFLETAEGTRGLVAEVGGGFWWTQVLVPGTIQLPGRLNTTRVVEPTCPNGQPSRLMLHVVKGSDEAVGSMTCSSSRVPVRVAVGSTQVEVVPLTLPSGVLGAELVDSFLGMKVFSTDSAGAVSSGNVVQIPGQPDQSVAAPAQLSGLSSVTPVMIRSARRILFTANGTNSAGQGQYSSFMWNPQDHTTKLFGLPATGGFQSCGWAGGTRFDGPSAVAFANCTSSTGITDLFVYGNQLSRPPSAAFPALVPSAQASTIFKVFRVSGIYEGPNGSLQLSALFMARDPLFNNSWMTMGGVAVR